MQPAPQTSISEPYIPEVNRNSGGRYQRDVLLGQMCSVKGGVLFIPRHDPKSASLSRFPLLSKRMFSGLISRWNTPTR